MICICCRAKNKTDRNGRVADASATTRQRVSRPGCETHFSLFEDFYLTSVRIRIKPLNTVIAAVTIYPYVGTSIER